MTRALISLPYAYDALEPFIDRKTMEIHHTKHHNAYVTNLNKALAQSPALARLSLETIVSDLAMVPEDLRTAIRNNGGGDLNHSLFWELMGPDKGGAPVGQLATAIDRELGSFSRFQEKFSKTAVSRFGSGWAWLSLDKLGRLVVHSTANQDSPLMEGLRPVLGLDVWEHAYYLTYQNRRPDYIQAWWNLVDWERAEEVYRAARG